MTSQRLNEYFAGEAADYLDQLEGILSEPGEPDRQRLLRLATGIRGSIQMAGAQAIGRLATRLEEAAREVNRSALELTDEIRDIALRTVTDIRSLVETLERWGPEEERKVQTSLKRWETLSSPVRGPGRPVVPIGELFYDDEGPHILSIGDGGENGGGLADAAAGERPVSAGYAEAVPIENLLFRGDDALEEARGLREAFESVARGDAVPERPLAALVDELFDLLDLASGSGSPEA